MKLSDCMVSFYKNCDFPNRSTLCENNNYYIPGTVAKVSQSALSVDLLAVENVP